ncbi:tuberin [Pogonomyrmex barbatus]|uniref:Tuberin n=1 Tax=Pogonomyrmex barbatus TaxID=144034 RepID=A0A8N1S945_9HYME|nr:tuberin [Pogonomyrmex barbatus]
MSKMSSKDKDNKTLQDRLKHFFRLNKGSYKSREEFILTYDIEKEISSDSPVHHRTKAIKELREAVLNQQWEDRAAERLWNLVKDLLGKDVPREYRHLTLNFLKCLVQGQYSKLTSLMRVKFFMVVKEYDIPEDIGPRLELLQTLTEYGKDILHLEERMGPFLLEWMPTVTAGDGKRGAEFLSLLVNVIKFNSAYIDEDIISGLVQYISHLCYYSNNTEVVSGCLEALDAIMCYSNLQSDSLQTFIIALCRSVNVETYCQTSWKIMRNLLGTHMGHCALYTMCRLLQDTIFQRDVRLLRGAVFYVNMGLWGTHRIPKLECTPASVLPSFYQALQCNHPIVMYEVTLSIQRLVNKYGNELWDPTWSIILDIIEEIITHTETSNQPATKQVSASLHETISNIESLLDANNYNGCIQRFYDLVERCSDSRPEGSVLKLIEYRASTIGPTYHQWQTKLGSLMERYYKIETRTSIRMKVLDVLANVIYINRSRYEDELIERIVVPYTQHVDIDTDITIRTMTANLIIDLCLECDSKRCIELLDILEKIINKPFTSDAPISMDADIKDVKTAVVGIIKIFTSKIYRLPSSHAICAYKILVNHLEQHYRDPSVFHDVSTTRYLVIIPSGSRGRRERPIMSNRMIGESRALDLKPPMDEGLMNFHIELIETCIDLMARYTFSNYSARPKRLPAADFLLKEGQSMTWILGNRLITVTTSGCNNKAMRGGLCDNCWVACKPGFLLFDHTKTSYSNLQRTSSIETSKEDKLSRQSSGGHGNSNANTATNSPTEESKKSMEDSDSMKKELFIEKTDKEQNESSKLGQILNSDKQDEHILCACWCQGWAEIYVRRPTGDMSWIMRIQNSTQFETPIDFPVHDIMALYMPNQDAIPNKPEATSEYSDDETEDVPSKNNSQSQNEHSMKPLISSVASGPIAIPGSPARPSPSRQSSRDSLESLEEGEEDTRRSRNPVRRSNSSPEMSANWKNPFLNKEKLNVQQQIDKDFTCSDLEIKLDADLKKHSKNIYTKDMRVSCEAIPEEIFGMGTTPPSSENTGEHPISLRSQRSYPGATQVTQTISTISNTVPPSPTSMQAPGNYLAIQTRSVQIQSSITKAPQSPTQIYSRLSSLDYNQKQMSSTVESKPPIGRIHIADKQKDERPDPSTLPPLPIPFRDRGHTISVMSPVKKSREWDNMRRGNSPRVKEPPRTGINPSFVFLQLYHAAHFGTTTEKPLLVPQTTAIQRAVTNLDRIQPYETHKIGVLYVGPGQASNEIEILANQHGSLRYTEFLKRLGTLVRLKDVDENVFLGGLDRNGENGEFAYIWQDDVTQVAFHVATLMPTKASDPKCTSKKTHIGNNYVTLVYNESEESYNIQTVKGQFNYACVVIQPLDHGTNQVTVQAREELAEHIGHSEPKIISDQNLAILSRQLALHANLASMVCSSLKQNSHNPYASNWLERLRHIKRLRNRILQEYINNNPETTTDELSPRTNKRVYMDDFTEYTT